jgi:hypothetical protein
MPAQYYTIINNLAPGELDHPKLYCTKTLVRNTIATYTY